MLKVFALAILIKLALIPTSHSTDFEVHRNWLAITHNLPLQKWYVEDTSQWTLDYPPFFAGFEYVLSQFAKYFDPNMLNIQADPYDSPMTTLYQHITVIVTDLVYFLGVYRFAKTFGDVEKGWFVTFLCALNPGLFIVDHIHFQYNGFLFGILLLSIAEMRQGRDLIGGILFAVLLNFKHIYAYLAPAYFFYLFRHYCFSDLTFRSFKIVNFLALGSAVIIVFAASFGPFIFHNQVGNVLGRLFPFKRGLTHAYWAANFWALYLFIDRVLYYALGNIYHLDPQVLASSTRGLVGDTTFIILPEITPQISLIATLISMLPAMYIGFKRPNFQAFLNSLILCAYSSFLFGWHVHEKAILLIIIPLSLVEFDKNLSRIFLLICAAGHFGLFPLLTTTAETPIKICITLGHFLIAYFYLKQKNEMSFSLIEIIYLFGFVLLQLFTSSYTLFPFSQRWEFLPLMLTSGYCSLGVVYTWLKFCVVSLRSPKKTKSQ